MENEANFINRLKKYPLDYIALTLIVALIAAWITSICLKDSRIIDLGPYPPNNDAVQTLDFEDIQGFYHNYDAQNLKVQEYIRKKFQDPKFIAARAVTFDYQDLKNYIAFIEKNAEEADIRITGLRFYYGQYRNNEDSTKSYRQTLFYNPTTKFTDTGDEDISYAIVRDDGITKAVELKKVLDTIPRNTDKEVIIQQEATNEASILSFLLNNTIQNPAQSQAANRGQVTPPPSDLADEEAQ